MSKSDSKNAANDLSAVAKAAVNALNKANEERFIKLQEYDKIFKWSCFYFSGSDIGDCCKANTNTVSRVLDPRLGCEIDVDKSVLWADFAITYKIYQRFIFPSYQPLFKESNTDSIEYFPGSFITACEFLNQSFGLDKGFFTKELKAEWSCILAGMVFLDKLTGFKKFAIETYGVNKDIIDIVTATSLSGNNLKINVDVYTKALLALQRYVGLNSDELKKIHGGFYNKTCSFLDSETKQKYILLEKEYKEEVEKLYNIIKDVGELMLCWNNAKVEETYIEGDNVNSNVNINQFLNCCGEIIESETGKTDGDNLSTYVSKLATRITKLENDTELDDKIKKIKIELIVLIVLIVVIFICISYLIFKIQIGSVKKFTNSNIELNNDLENNLNNNLDSQINIDQKLNQEL